MGIKAMLYIARLGCDPDNIPVIEVEPTMASRRLAGAAGRRLGRPEMRLAIEIGGLRFATKGAAVKHFQAILYRHEIGATTRGTEELFQT